MSHKVKRKVYKAQLQLKNQTLSAIFPEYSGSLASNTSQEGVERPKKIFISENLTRYRKEMLDFAFEKKKDEKILSAWTLDGKLFIKTSPDGRPRRMFSKEEIKEL